MNYQSDSPKSWMMAATFAEAGEWDTALTMIPAARPAKETNRFFKLFAAVAFAEEGMHEEALRIYGAPPRKAARIELDALKELGAGKAHIRYGRIYCK
ncbi:MAG: hypothetical protein HY885_16780 [Deltaproteobacteria bacterium]|nr:hypothetical protein [Deltaproteobacteria bacterium]